VPLQFGIEIPLPKMPASVLSISGVMQISPCANSAISSSVAAPSPFLARNFMRVTSRHRFR